MGLLPVQQNSCCFGVYSLFFNFVQMIFNEIREKLQDIVRGTRLQGSADRCSAVRNLLVESFGTGSTVKSEFESRAIASLAIGRNLEIGEGYAPNFFAAIEAQPENKIPSGVSNPHHFTVEELMEISDYNIQLWMNLKTELRKYGQIDPKIFVQEASKAPTPNGDKSASPSRKKSAEKEDKE